VPHNVVLLVDPPTVVAADIHPQLPDQANLLIQIAQGHRFDNLFALLVGTGLRLGEAQALRWQDVDLDNAHLRVRHTLLRLKANRGGSESPRVPPADAWCPLMGLALRH
jgi:integrase